MIRQAVHGGTTIPARNTIGAKSLAGSSIGRSYSILVQESITSFRFFHFPQFTCLDADWMGQSPTASARTGGMNV